MNEITVTINGRSFAAKLNNSAAAQAQRFQMPLTLVMNELNGNEKYADLKKNLATHSVCPGHVSAGDLMLFGNHCLVLFYKSFATSYAYTALGSILDPQGLAEAVGSGSVEVTFCQTEGNDKIRTKEGYSLA